VLFPPFTPAPDSLGRLDVGLFFLDFDLLETLFVFALLSFKSSDTTLFILPYSEFKVPFVPPLKKRFFFFCKPSDLMNPFF